MVKTRLFQLIGTYSCGLHSLGNIGIDIVKLRLAQLHIHSAQNIDGIHHCLPVKCGKIIYLKVQISVQGLHCLFRTSQEISLVNLIVQPVITYTEISIPEHADKLNLAAALVNVAYDDNIGIIAFSNRIVSAVHAKKGNGPVSLHLLHLSLGDIRVGHLGRFKLAWLNQANLVLRIPVEPCSQKEYDFQYDKYNYHLTAALNRCRGRVRCRRFPGRPAAACSAPVSSKGRIPALTGARVFRPCIGPAVCASASAASAQISGCRPGSFTFACVPGPFSRPAS